MMNNYIMKTSKAQVNITEYTTNAM